MFSITFLLAQIEPPSANSLSLTDSIRLSPITVKSKASDDGMGESLIESVKLSEFAEGGSIWASKKVIENMSPGDRQRVEFGVRLGTGHERFVSPGIYSQVKELISGDELQQRGLREISNLAVTEIINVHPPEEQDL